MITGKLMRDGILSAANNINNHRKEVDALNVFPVPDGDTGTNMSMTMGAAAREVTLLHDDADFSTVINTAASALLRGARGNSGVILSLIFRGIARGVKDSKTIDSNELAVALQSGSKTAYKAVMKPTEGTILTVVRIASEKAKASAAKGDDVLTLWGVVCESAEEALADTPNILPVLKKAGVVDAGGQGLVYIFDGIKSVLETGTIIQSSDGENDAKQERSAIISMSNEDIKFAYCTEFLINKNAKSNKDSLKLRAYFESIGDSVVVVDDDSLIKVHIHTNEPGNALQAALKYGSLVNIKIENMHQQHENADWGVGSEVQGQEDAMMPVKPEKPYGMVAVAYGEGLETLFMELGVDRLVAGGQTMNPSTEDILRAVNATPAERVFVFPNNKNIIMAAEQVIPLTEKKVSVLQTRTIPQGITAALNFDESLSPEENHLNMMKAAEKVNTGLVTFAARDSVVNGQSVKKGQVIGMENGKITLSESTTIQAAFRITKHMFKRGSSSLITVIYGADKSEKHAEELHSMLKAKYGNDADISVINGGQPVYYFIISVE
ncbi:MAG TPA: DAK2 domain-containing protein [Clostridia bacterium]|nr:DAK2 domain-containing protein [Clostridia bacterium]